MNNQGDNHAAPAAVVTDSSTLQVGLSQKFWTSSLTSEAAAALLDLRKTELGIGPLTIPTYQRYDTRTGLVHGTIRVQKKKRGGGLNSCGSAYVRFEFWLEREKDDGTNLPLLVSFRPLLRPPSSSLSSEQPQQQPKKKEKTSAYDWIMEKRHFMIAQYSHPDQVMGEVAVSPFRNQNVVTFTVTLGNQVDCCLFYKVHPLPNVLAKDAPPRELEFVRFTERAKKAARMEGGDSTQFEDNQFYTLLLNEFCQLLQPQPPPVLKKLCGPGRSSLEGATITTSLPPPGKIMCDSNFLSIFSSVRPTPKGGMKVPSLNMKGRGLVTSNKNMQLVNADGVVCLQVAKVDSETFHVDFRAPFNAFQAFAFGIAQIVL